MEATENKTLQITDLKPGDLLPNGATYLGHKFIVVTGDCIVLASRAVPDSPFHENGFEYMTWRVHNNDSGALPAASTVHDHYFTNSLDAARDFAERT